MKRRLFSLILAVCLMVGLCIPAWATGTVTNETGLSTERPPSGGSVETTLTGTFSYTNIKVTIPTSVQFTMDPTKTVTSTTPRAQVTSGGTFTVSNYSNVPLYLHVGKVSCTGVSLTKTLSNITDSSKAIYFTMYSKGDAVPDLTKSTLADDEYMGDLYFRMSADSAKRHLVTKTAIDAGSLTSPVDRECYVAARAGLGFNTGESFEIKVTFVVSQDKSTYFNRGVSTEPE